MKKKFSLNQKLVFTMLTLGIIPMLIMGFISLYQSQDSMRSAAENKILLMRQSVINKISDFFEKTVEHTKVVSADVSTVTALREFSEAFELLEKEIKEKTSETNIKNSLKNYYEKEFKDKYKTLNSNNEYYQYEKNISTMSGNAIAAQFLYVTENKNALGEKNKQLLSSFNTSYDRVHTAYHQSFGEYISVYKHYDFFLIDLKGNVVYSAFKELDFATNLYEGFTANTDLARAFKEAIALKDPNGYVLTDVSPYPVSYNLPASFISRPVFDQGKLIGAIVFQIDLSQIANRATMDKKWKESGFGDTGEVFVVAKDLSLRSDMRKFLENKDSFFINAKKQGMNETQIQESKLKNSLIYYGKFENSLLQRAVTSGSSLTDTVLGSDGEKDFQAVSPLGFSGLDWFVVAQIHEEELFSELVKMKYFFYAQVAIAVILIGILSFLFSRKISNELNDIAAKLSENATKLLSSSKQLSQMSIEISEATTEQASGLQETVSSIDEISAMVAKNSDSAQQSQEMSSKSRLAAGKGKETIEAMIESMDKINESNREITDAMEENNKQIHEIVRVINEIGTKTKVINDIVFQTKLLSFNASVEAARAGEHGKGFAVVAEEVGNLAQMSGKAAEEISSMLTDSVKKVESIAQLTASKVDKLISRGKERIDHGTQVARECGDTLGEIYENVTKVNQMISEISIASKEQSQGVTEITKAMSQLDQATQSNAAAAEKASVAGGDLNREAHSMEDTVQQLTFLVVGKINNIRHEKHAERSEGHPINHHSGQGKSFHNNVVSIKSNKHKLDKQNIKLEKNNIHDDEHEDNKATAVGSDVAVANRTNMSLSTKTSSGESVPSFDHKGFEEI